MKARLLGGMPALVLASIGGFPLFNYVKAAGQRTRMDLDPVTVAAERGYSSLTGWFGLPKPTIALRGKAAMRCGG